MKKFVVLHSLLDVDRYVFPGCQTGVFFRPEQWPEKVKKELSVSEKIAKKHSLKLLKGEINLEKNITKLEIEAKSAKKIHSFYVEWGVELNYLQIEEYNISAEGKMEINERRYGIDKDTSYQVNLPLFKANKLMKKSELGLKKLRGL